MLNYYYSLWLLTQTLNHIEEASKYPRAIYQIAHDIHIAYINVDLSELAADGIY